MYRFLKVAMWFIRQFAIPNSFNVLAPGITVYISGAPLLLTPDILNWVAGLFIPGLSFALAGLFYCRGDDEPTKGSLLYMLFFITNTIALALMSAAYPWWWLVALIGVAYLVGVGYLSFVLRNSY